MNGRKFKIGVVLIALILAISLAVFENYKKNRNEQLAAEEKAEQENATELDRQRRIAQLASKTNAITKWREEFSSKGEFLFTIDVTRVFVRPDGRPLVFERAEAQDVTQRGEEFHCYFGVDLSRNEFPKMGNTTRRFIVSGTELGQEPLGYYKEYLLLSDSIENTSTTARLVLSCDPLMAKEIMQGGEGKNYAVVARISTVPLYNEITTGESSDDSVSDIPTPDD